MIAYPNCKINIGLNILSKRPDGFHNIETVFYPISLCDILEIVSISSNSNLPLFTNTGLVIDVPDNKNLCLKAYNLLKHKYSLPSVAIHLHKIIPFGAGLGGGSSDAASTLLLLNKIFNLNLSDWELAEYASEIGSDCAFFVYNKPSYATGRGEVIKPIDINLKGKFILLVKPDIHISTAQAYEGVNPVVHKESLKELICFPLDQWKNNISNMFESHLFLKHPELSEIKEKMYSFGAIYAAMSGSGSTIYGIFDHKIDVSSIFAGKFTWSSIL